VKHANWFGQAIDHATTDVMEPSAAQPWLGRAATDGIQGSLSPLSGLLAVPVRQKMAGWFAIARKLQREQELSQHRGRERLQ
jgi:hypothetical protein